MTLIDCKTCGGKLAALAEACPGCGAPNDWMHEDIQRFVEASSAVATSRPFSYSQSKTTLSGQTELRTPIWAWMLAAFVCLASTLAFFFFPLWAVLIGGAACGVILKGTQRADYFQADLQARTWVSSNERFWQPVRQMLRL